MNAESMPRDGKTTDQSATQDFVSLPGRQLAWTVLGVMLAMLSQTNLTTAMPRIIAELGGFDRYAWASAAYLVAATIAAPIAGRLSDLYGRKSFLILGLSVFMLGSILASTSRSMTQLIAFRSVQGLGGGIIVVSCLVAIADLFSPDKRGRFQGLAALVFGMTSVIGPPLGGFITDRFSWNWVLLINVPAGIPVLLLVLRFPRRNSRPDISHLDYPGMLTLILAVVSILLALSWGGIENGWDSPVVLGLLGLGLVMATVFVFIELKSESPIMPLEIYRDRMVVAAAALTFLTGFSLYGAALFTPLFFQVTAGATATRSGSVLTPMMLGIVFGGIVSGLTLRRATANYRLQAILSAVAVSGGMSLLSTLDKNTNLGLAMGFLAITGLGIGGALATSNVAVQNSVPHRLWEPQPQRFNSTDS